MAVRNLNNYKMVDIMKYVAAIMVICIHSTPVIPQEQINFFFTQVICRMAVPFFFVSSGYFVRKGCQKHPDYLKGYLKTLSKSYLMWSIVFLPIGLDWIRQNVSLAGNLIPLALLYGLIYVGTYYHLWYIPALLFSLFLATKLLKRISYKVIFPVSLLLFLFGSLESYYGLIPSGGFKNFFDQLILVVYTTRSGLLFGLIFVVIGFFIYDYQDKLERFLKYIPFTTLLCGILLLLEGSFLYTIKNLDMNFLLMLVPFSFSFFLWILSFPKVPRFDTRKVRELSKYYYFIHPIFIVIVQEIGKAFQWRFLTSGIVSLLLIILMTHIMCLIIINVQHKKIKYFRIMGAALLGIAVTYVVVSLIYQFKFDNILLKFELVPCFWVFSSFGMYYLLRLLPDFGTNKIEKSA